MQKLWKWFLIGLIVAISFGCAPRPMQSNPTVGKATEVMVLNEPTAQIALIPVSSEPSSQNEPVCPGTYPTRARTLEIGETLYSFYCAGCHGRQGQGYPNGYFPPLVDSTLAVSDNIQPAVDIMMNTDIHGMATLLFEKDALSVISYIRTSFGNSSMVCSGDVEVRVNP